MVVHLSFTQSMLEFSRISSYTHSIFLSINNLLLTTFNSIQTIPTIVRLSRSLGHLPVLNQQLQIFKVSWIGEQITSHSFTHPSLRHILCPTKNLKHPSRSHHQPKQLWPILEDVQVYNNNCIIRNMVHDSMYCGSFNCAPVISFVNVGFNCNPANPLTRFHCATVEALSHSFEPSCSALIGYHDAIVLTF